MALIAIYGTKIMLQRNMESGGYSDLPPEYEIFGRTKQTRYKVPTLYHINPVQYM